MPIPVRCSQCSKGLKVPDKYAGKKIKCPDCQTGINVPAGGSAAAKTRKPAKSKVKVKPTAVAPPMESDSDFLADMNLGDSATIDTTVQLCPKCATEVPDDEIVCDNCGHNLSTGRLDDAIAKKRSRKGPDPTDFIKVAWSDSLTFLKANFSLAKKTTIVWAIFGTLASIFAVVLAGATKGPIITFWTGLAGLSTFAVAGWYWFLSEVIVRMTMDREEKLKRLNTDTFQTLALGIKAVVWPFVMGLPVWILVFGGLIASGTPILSEPDFSARIAELEAQEIDVDENVQAGLQLQADSIPGRLARLQFIPAIVLSCTYVAMYMLFPIAQIHLVSRYTYKASVLWELFKVVPKNLVAVGFWNFLAFCLIGPIAGLFIVLEVYGGGGNLFTNDHITWCGEKFGTWLYGFTSSGPAENSLLYKLFRELTKASLCFLSISFISFLASMPAVMLMRITGKFGLYNARTLGITDKTHHGDPAGFWVRYVAFAIDCFCIPFAALVAAREKAQSALSGLFTAVFVLSYMGYPAALADMFLYVSVLFLIVNGWVYYSVLESGTARASIGKENMKLVAETEAGKQKSIGSASLHYMTSLFTLPLFFITGITPQKQSLGDKFAKCRVVWKGEG